MPSEFENDISEIIVKKGNEFGTTTGRKRRIGWLDLPLLKRAIQVNNVNTLCITNMDVLEGFEEVGLCKQYKIGDVFHSYSSFQLHDWVKTKPVVDFVPGWETLNTRDIAENGWDSLSVQAKDFLDLLHRETGIQVNLVSFGREREMYVGRNLGFI